MWIHFQEFSHDFTIFFIALTSPNHDYEFIHDFIIMNSLAWIQRHEFKDEFIFWQISVSFHDSLHDHKFISDSEFILWIHIRFHDDEFICYISWPMNSHINSFICRIVSAFANCFSNYRDVLSKLAMAKNWKLLVSSSNPTAGALVVWPGIRPEQSW